MNSNSGGLTPAIAEASRRSTKTMKGRRSYDIGSVPQTIVDTNESFNFPLAQGARFSGIARASHLIEDAGEWVITVADSDISRILACLLSSRT
jgi:hypothetical protein